MLRRAHRSDLQQQPARALCDIIADWSPIDFVGRLGIYPARISELRHGNLARFSIGWLVNLIASLRFDIEISIRPTQPPRPIQRHPSATVVRYDRFDRVQPTTRSNARSL